MKMLAVLLACVIAVSTYVAIAEANVASVQTPRTKLITKQLVVTDGVQGDVFTATAKCPKGTFVTGGGVNQEVLAVPAVQYASYPSSTTSWSVIVRMTNHGGVTFNAWAVCEYK